MGTQEIKAACRGCHGGCMHILTVEDGRVVKVRPDPEGPLNHGHACVKGMTIIEQMYHPDRLLYPMRRKGERGNGLRIKILLSETGQRHGRAAAACVPRGQAVRRPPRRSAALRMVRP